MTHMSRKLCQVMIYAQCIMTLSLIIKKKSCATLTRHLLGTCKAISHRLRSRDLVILKLYKVNRSVFVLCQAILRVRIYGQLIRQLPLNTLRYLKRQVLSGHLTLQKRESADDSFNKCDSFIHVTPLNFSKFRW